MKEKTHKNEFEKQFAKIKNLIRSIPETPGVYKMKDSDNNVIYIGKAKNLKRRVAQYFQLSKTHSIKVKKMVAKIQDIDIIETNNEMEALILETNLIKEERPRYNVLMKDDKNYVYMKISTNEDYPRLSIVRKREKDNAIYLGPKTSADHCEKLINLLRKIFPIRTCNLEMKDGKNGLIHIIKKTIPIPCLDYHIKRCAGPCIDKIKKKEYNAMFKQIINFLKGNVQELITKLKYNMFNAANNKNFEKAAKIRDQIKAVESIFTKQVVSNAAFIDRDVLGIHPDFDKTFINLFQFRGGKLIAQENFTLDTPQNISVDNDTERSSSVIESFLRSYYTETTDIPTEIFLREKPLHSDLWEDWLSNKRHTLKKLYEEIDRKKVHFLCPMKGEKNKIITLSEKNAATFARQSRAKWMSDTAKTTQAARDLADELGIEKDLNRIECYDISHMGGEHTTASMVVFIKGSANKKLYRHFKVKTLENGEIDDHASINEILNRRLQRLSNFATHDTEHYQFKKPLKKDFTLIEQAFRDEKIIKKNEKLDAKQFIGLYYDIDEEIHLTGYTQLIEHNGGKSAQIGVTWIENEHLNRALKHKLWTKLIEKIKLSHIYAVSNSNEKEDYLSYGFTELKKTPDFLRAQSTGSSERSHFLIYKIIKKKKTDTSFSEIPDLIIIDGGKSQLGVVHKLVSRSRLPIPIIGLSKKEEEIFLPITHESKTLNNPDTPRRIGKENKEKTNTRYQRIVLAQNSQALYLIQRIRDESHRFANELRKKLGKKKLTESEIDDIPGIGLIIKRRLLREYGSINAIKASPMEDLERVVGSYIAKMLKTKLGDSSQ